MMPKKPIISKMPAKSVSLENDIRDIINWIAVFKEEYGIADEATDVLRDKLESLARKASVCK